MSLVSERVPVVSLGSRRMAVAAGLATICVWGLDLAAQRLTMTALVLSVAWFLARIRFPSRRITLLVLSSPLVTVPLLASAMTVVHYARGTAQVVRSAWGRPADDGRNLDPEYRAFTVGGACALDVSALVLSTVRRATFSALFHALGPMPGAYTGAYPDLALTRALLATTGVELDPNAWHSDELVVKTRRIHVSPLWRDRVGNRPVRRVVGTISGDCAIVLVETEDDDFISLVDLGGFGWFATYRQRRAAT